MARVEEAVLAADIEELVELARLVFGEPCNCFVRVYREMLNTKEYIVYYAVVGVKLCRVVRIMYTTGIVHRYDSDLFEVDQEDALRKAKTIAERIGGKLLPGIPDVNYHIGHWLGIEQEAKAAEG